VSLLLVSLIKICENSALRFIRLIRMLKEENLGTG